MELAQPFTPAQASEAVPHTFDYTRRRPMHPSRFVDFAARHFGPFQRRPSGIAGTAADRAGELCRRRRGDHDEGVAFLGPGGVPEPADGAEACEARSPDWEVAEAAGCIWLAGSDDRQLEWVVGGPRGHRLRPGPAWPEPEAPGQPGDAGERRNAVRFSLRERRPAVSPPAQREPAEVAERRLRAALEACLLTREEAAALEHGDFRVLEGLGAVRPDCPPPGGEPSPLPTPLRALQAVVNAVHAVPGSEKLAGVGYAMARATERWLGGGHDGPGHNDSDECGGPGADSQPGHGCTGSCSEQGHTLSQEQVAVGTASSSSGAAARPAGS